MKRRDFVRNTALTALSSPILLPRIGSDNPQTDYTKLTILHTNDQHSRIEPFPKNAGSNAGKGGIAKRAVLVESIREKEENVLLLDSGDIFQGTPYFNFFGGELEFKLMSAMQYDASTLGNHDFDAGLDGFYKQLPHATFPFISTNYDHSDTILHDSTLPYLLLEKGALKIGIIGLGIELEGLVPKNLFGTTLYQDPIRLGDQTAKMLKKKQGADLVICLSHLGYQYFEQKIDDLKLAQNTEHIDIILGGHTHTFLQRPTILQNLSKKPVIINQAGWGGIMLGRLDLYFSKNKSRAKMTASNLIIK